MTLKRTAVDAVRWTGLAAVLTAGLQLLQLFVLARLLRPEDFGLMAMVLVVLGFAQIYADMGMSNAIIHRRQATRDQLSSLYWINLLVGLALFAMVAAVSPILVMAFGEPSLARLIPISALIFLIVPIGRQFEVLLEKDLKFGELALFDSVSVVVGVVVAIGAALDGQGVFSLVYGRLSTVAVKTVFLVAIGFRRWRPRWHFRARDLDGYLSFGLFQLGERTVNYLNERLDQLVIGLLLGAQVLGYYSLAYTLIALPAMRINPIMTRVAFPVMARLQDDPGKLKLGFMTMRQVLAAINFPLLLGIFAVAPVFIPLMAGPQWLPSVVLIQILALAAIVRSIGNPIGTLLLARGRPDLGFYINCALTPVMLVALYAGASLAGAPGAAVGLLLTVLAFFGIGYAFLVRPLLGPCFGEYISSVTPAAVAAGLMAVVVVILPRLVPLEGYALLTAQVLLGAMVYATLHWTLYREKSVAMIKLALGRDA